MKNKNICLCSFLALLALLPSLAHAQHAHPEKWYQSRWCEPRGLAMETVLPDGSRADCQNATHVIEFDFGKKWAESIGQALNYGAQTGKAPGIVLIMERPGDTRYLDRVRTVREAYGLPLEVWVVDGEGRAITQNP